MRVARLARQLSTTAAPGDGVHVSFTAASIFAQKHWALATIFGAALSASVLTAVIFVQKDAKVALALLEKDLEKDVALARAREEFGVALMRTREELGVALIRTREELSGKLLEKDVALMRTREELGGKLLEKDVALARAREELGVTVARAGHMDAKILDLLMHGDYAKAREQLEARSRGGSSAAP